MKNELILIGAIMLCAQVEGQRATNQALRLSIKQTGIHSQVERQTHIKKYTSPIDELDKLTSPAGYREMMNPFTGGTMSTYHKGLDMVGNWHCTIKPIALNGEVVDVWMPPSKYYKGHPVFGGYVRIKHTDNWVEGHGHLSSIYVREGDLLIDGLFYRDGKVIGSKNVLGRQGNTGLSTGEHLHLSIEMPSGEFVDPLRWMEL